MRLGAKQQSRRCQSLLLLLRLYSTREGLLYIISTHCARGAPQKFDRAENSLRVVEGNKGPRAETPKL